MQVGDLVRVYHFSHTARKHYRSKRDRGTGGYIPDDIDGHNIGLIVAETHSPSCDDWMVLIPKWNQQDIYHENVIEVINEGR